MPEFDYQEGDIIRAGHGYKVLKQLGSGGMSGCYLGEHRKMYRRCAIKVLHSRLWNRPDLVEMFEYEGRTIARLGQPAPHEGIIEILDLGRTSDRGEMPYLVMPYLFGETLDNALKRVGPFSVLSAIGMATRLLLALQYAHERGVIHRDVKPQNIFLVQPQLRSVLPDASDASEIVVKLLDWGIMKLVSSIDERGVFIGTPAWASPEQVAGDGVGTSSDLYSAGVVLFETLTGRRPFMSPRNDRESLLRARSGGAPRLCAHGSFPDELEELVARMLAVDPGKRPADARSVVIELQAIADAVRTSADHVTDRVVFARPPNRDPEPITDGSIAAPTFEDTDVPRRIQAEIRRQEAVRQTLEREGAEPCRAELTGFESTVEERGESQEHVFVAPPTGPGHTVKVGPDPVALRRSAETNVPAPASGPDGPALSVRYVTEASARVGARDAARSGSPHSTKPLPDRPRARPLPARAGARQAPRLGARAKTWLAHIARKPTRADAFTLTFAGASAAVLMLVALWLLGLWPNHASVSAANPDPSSEASGLTVAAEPTPSIAASTSDPASAHTSTSASAPIFIADTAPKLDADASSPPVAPSSASATASRAPALARAPVVRREAKKYGGIDDFHAYDPVPSVTPASALPSKDAGAPKRSDYVVDFE